VAVALATLALLWLAPAAWWGASRGWALLGWAIIAVTAVAGGWALETWHGRPGAGFLAALAACILARLFGGTAGAFAASAAPAAGDDPVRAFLVGLVATFLPLQLLEIVWFVRKARKTTPVRG
jgi:hypothetical protein